MNTRRFGVLGRTLLMVCLALVMVMSGCSESDTEFCQTFCDEKVSALTGKKNVDSSDCKLLCKEGLTIGGLSRSDFEELSPAAIRFVRRKLTIQAINELAKIYKASAVYYTSPRDTGGPGRATLVQQCERGDGEACSKAAQEIKGRQPQKAIRLLKKGCDAADARSCFYLARDVKSSSEALKLYGAACELNLSEACHNAGKLYEDAGKSKLAEFMYYKGCELGIEESCEAEENVKPLSTAFWVMFTLALVFLVGLLVILTIHRRRQQTAPEMAAASDTLTE